MTQTPWLIVPMAGFGQRFRDAGYQDDKPLIKVGGHALLQWSLDPIPESWKRNIIGIVRHEQATLRDSLFDLSYGMAHVEIHGPTQGAACTVLAAAVGLPPDDPVCVMNADQYFKIGHQTFPCAEEFYRQKGCNAHQADDLAGVHAHAMVEGWDGFILTFPGTGSAWSYAVTNGTNRVVHVIEKKEVSKFATVGFYWWRRAGDLVRSICAMIATGQKTNSEFYLAPSFNFLPLSDKNVQIVEVEEFHGLGTPEQVKEFEALLATGWTP